MIVGSGWPVPAVVPPRCAGTVSTYTRRCSWWLGGAGEGHVQAAHDGRPLRALVPLAAHPRQGMLLSAPLCSVRSRVCCAFAAVPLCVGWPSLGGSPVDWADSPSASSTRGSRAPPRATTPPPVAPSCNVSRPSLSATSRPFPRPCSRPLIFWRGERSAEESAEESAAESAERRAETGAHRAEREQRRAQWRAVKKQREK